jgi:hypothetical protein
MLSRRLTLAAVLGLMLAGLALPAAAQDADICLTAAERVAAGEELAEAEKKDAHEACQRALSDTASVIQKYQFQEADFEIMGTRPKN